MESVGPGVIEKGKNMESVALAVIGSSKDETTRQFADEGGNMESIALGVIASSKDDSDKDNSTRQFADGELVLAYESQKDRIVRAEILEAEFEDGEWKYLTKIIDQYRGDVWLLSNRIMKFTPDNRSKQLEFIKQSGAVRARKFPHQEIPRKVIEDLRRMRMAASHLQRAKERDMKEYREMKKWVEQKNKKTEELKNKRTEEQKNKKQKNKRQRV